MKGSCGQGWVPKSKVEYVAQKAGDKSMKLEDVDIVGWLDNPSAVFVLENDDIDFDGVNIDRDFKEYLQHTMDRETMEMRNGENELLNISECLTRGLTLRAFFMW